VERYRDFLAPEGAGAALPLRDVCWSAGTTRTHFDERITFVARSRPELLDRFDAWLAGAGAEGASEGRARPGGRRLAFVFSGQESQWEGMGAELYAEEPAFRDALDACAEVIRRHEGWSPVDVLTGRGGGSRLESISVAQPAIFAVQMALAGLWRSWGIEPDVWLGHSMGEVAAACASGKLDLDDAVRVICARSRLGERLVGRGAMASVQLGCDEVREILRGHEDRVSVAAEQNADSVLLAGEPEPLERVLERAREAGIFTRRLGVAAASHSPLVEPLLAEFLEEVGDIVPRATPTALVSTVTGALEDGAALDAQYWARNARQPVLFWTALRAVVERGVDVVLEVSPHPVLFTSVDAALRELGGEGRALFSMRRNAADRAALLETVGTLHGLGHPVDWRRLEPEGRAVRLPTYPWQGRRFWIDEHPAAVAGATVPLVPGSAAAGGSGFCVASTRNGAGSARVSPATHPGEVHWQGSVGCRSHPWLGDHRAGELAVLPGAAYLEMALAAAKEVCGEEEPVLEDVRFERAMPLPPDADRCVQVSIQPEAGGGARFGIASAPASTPVPEWTRHARGVVRRAGGAAAEDAGGGPDAHSVRAACGEPESSEAFYERLERCGFGYGEAFRSVQSASAGGRRAWGRVALSEQLALGAGRYAVHPALLDGAFQLVAAGVLDDPERAARGIHVPVALDRIRVRRPAGAAAWVALETRAPDASSDEVAADLRLLDDEGDVLVEVDGLRLRALESAGRAELDDKLFAVRWDAQPRAGAPDPAAVFRDASWIVFCDAGGVGAALAERIESHGGRCVRVHAGGGFRRRSDAHYEVDPASPSDFEALLREAFANGHPACRGVAHLWSLDAPSSAALTTASLARAQDPGVHGLLHAAQALVGAGWEEAPALWIVTRCAQAVRAGDRGGLEVAQAPVWGLGKTLGVEQPELRCRRVDLDAAGPACADELVRELSHEGDEYAIALRDGARFVQRLTRHDPGAEDAAVEGLRAEPAAGRAFRLEIGERGLIENLRLRAHARSDPAEDLVEVAVRAAAINFEDVLGVLGVIPALGSDPSRVGCEFAGVVTAVGPGVDGVSVGDEVVGVAPGIRSHVQTRAEMVTRKPATSSFEQAVSVPVAFMTAHYAMNELGRMRAGEKILIHAASGGVGLAAVQLARRAGLEVFATAGSEAKREHLRSLGLEHVMDSRSLDFADEVLERTGGRGVDLVLNCLNGPEAIAKNFEVLAPYGRFLEIGIRDIFERRDIPLWPFHKNLSYHAVLLMPYLVQRPEEAGAMLRSLFADLEAGALETPPLNVFPVSRVVDAFQLMARAEHIGKVVLSFDDPDVRILPERRSAAALRADGTYVVTGGLGGIGLYLAAWMVEQGARHLVLVGRSGTSRPGSREAVDALRARGAEVEVVCADVADPAALGTALDAARRRMPPLRGVLHAAVVLEDGLLVGQDREAFRRVMDPKVLGAWNLHELTADDPLDFFVLFSSLGTLLGSPGQGSYTAANAFLDALAHHRRGLGLPALCVDWGPWSEVGGAALQGLTEGMERLGISSLSPREGARALQRLLDGDAPQVGVFGLDPRRFFEAYPAAARAPLYAELAREAGDAPARRRGSARVRRELLSLEDARERLTRLRAYLAEQIGQALRLEASRIDPRTQIFDYGVDSLTAVELRNRIERDLGIESLAATVIMLHPTVEALAPVLARKADIPVEDGGERDAPDAGASSARARAERRAAARRAARGPAETAP